MSECKDCNCSMKYVNDLLKTNTKNKSILCKKNYTNLKFIFPLELVFYFTSFALLGYYNSNKNSNKNTHN